MVSYESERALAAALEGAEAAARHLAAEIGLEKSAASKHLSQLKEAGLVEDERRGTLVEYRLVAPCVLDMAACAEGTILENRRKRLEIPGEG